jgi:hypothetical protein
MHPSRRLMFAACLAVISTVCFAAPAFCQAPVPAEPKSLAFVVNRVERRPAGEFILTFENGEVWQQSDPNKKINIERGEQVVIRRSKTGVFTLVSRSGDSVRVKRVH